MSGKKSAGLTSLAWNRVLKTKCERDERAADDRLGAKEN